MLTIRVRVAPAAGPDASNTSGFRPIALGGRGWTGGHRKARYAVWIHAGRYESLTRDHLSHNGLAIAGVHGLRSWSEKFTIRCGGEQVPFPHVSGDVALAVERLDKIRNGADIDWMGGDGDAVRRHAPQDRVRAPRYAPARSIPATMLYVRSTQNISPQTEYFWVRAK